MFALVLALANGLVGLARIAAPVREPDTARWDIAQEYLMARAVHDGVSPYQPINQLARRYLPDQERFAQFTHPTPHPPPVAVLSQPLGALDFRSAANAWLGFELLCLALALVLLARLLAPSTDQRGTLARGALYALIVLGFEPVVVDLRIGQFGPPLLLLLVLTWHRWQNDRWFGAGMALGGALALKLTGWPIVVFLLLRRRWRPALAAVALAAVANLLAAAVIGWRTVFDYYTSVGPEVTRTFQPHRENMSVFTFGPRLFRMLWLDSQLPPAAAPLVQSAVTAGLVAAALGGGWLLALRARRSENTFAILTILSMVANPVAWGHYQVLLLLPLVLLARQAQDGEPGLRRVVIPALVAVAVARSATLALYADTSDRATSLGVVAVVLAVLVYADRSAPAPSGAAQALATSGKS